MPAPSAAPMRYVLGAIDMARDGYAAIVKRLVRVPCSSLVVVGGFLALNGWLFKVIPGGFLPSEDQGAFFVEAQLPEGASVNRTAVVAERVEKILQGIPGVADISTVVGYSTLDGLSKSNSAYFIVLLQAVRGADRRRARTWPRSSPRCAPRVRRSARPTSSRSTCRRSSGSAPAAASSTSCSTCRAAIPPTSPPSRGR